MVILAPIALWLAKFLLRYFLDTHLQLKRELEVAVKHEEDARKSLQLHEKKREQLDQEIVMMRNRVMELRQDLIHIAEDQVAAEKLHEEKSKHLKDTIAGMSADDIMRYDILRPSRGGESGDTP